MFWLPSATDAPPSFWNMKRAHSSAQLSLPPVTLVMPHSAGLNVMSSVILARCAVVESTCGAASAACGDGLDSFAGFLSVLAM